MMKLNVFICIDIFINEAIFLFQVYIINLIKINVFTISLIKINEMIVSLNYEKKFIKISYVINKIINFLNFKYFSDINIILHIIYNYML